MERDVYTQATPAWTTIRVEVNEKEIFKYYDGVFPIIKANNRQYTGTKCKIYRKIEKIAEEIAEIADKYGMLVQKNISSITGYQKWLVKNKEAINKIKELISKAEEILASVA